MAAAAYPLSREGATDTRTAQATTATWRDSVEYAVRRFAAITLAGALLGALVGGVGSRLAMMLLAVLNPAATGVISDDGFRIGQLTLSGSLQLVGTGVQLGLLGAAVYAAVRALMIGPRWFQVLSIATGPAVVVGAILVHRTGVDFTALQPTWLAIALFMAIPGVFAGLLTLLAERWLGSDRWFARARLRLVAPVLVLWVVLAPLVPVVALVWVVGEWLRRRPELTRAFGSPVIPWAARLGLTAVFVLALLDLVRDAGALT